MHRRLELSGRALFLSLLGLVAAAASTIPASARPDPPPARPRIEVVFALDTTGSMSGLIQGAKQKIWEIVDQLASGRPSPEIRIGLVGYRDRSDEYVTRRVQLDDDIDSIFAELTALSSGGGGDTPESVNQALHEAVAAMDWSQGPDVYKVIFLVGDAPPHMDYPDDVKYPHSVALASAGGIRINTIQCGSMSRTATVWQAIASGADGSYVQIEQGGGMRAKSTPWDAALAAIARQLAETVLPFGSEAEQAATRQKLDRSLEAGSSASASRLSFLGKKGGRVVSGRGDLVDATIEGRVDPASLPLPSLPEEMQALSAEERVQLLEDAIARRKGLQSEVAYLAGKRDAFLRAQAKRAGSFDEEVLAAIREQAAERGIRYD